ncbi:MAG: hypothetical protein IT193_10715 [Propionibacteriaceae bacterium]|nr:hypothetical protein [Propionibacteriaceae bacterium]
MTDTTEMVEMIDPVTGEIIDQKQGPSPRIVDTVVVDYAAVGSVVARWAS